MITATEFTPVSGIVGGTLIGLSAVVLMATVGRVAGASGIFSGLLTTRFDENFNRSALFIFGLLVGTAVTGLFWFDENQIAFPSGTLMTALSGLIVGIGVTLGAGCTSGHGICGLSRFSLRSLVATCVFMAIAILTVLVSRHVMGA
jgi:uncharacterized protein